MADVKEKINLLDVIPFRSENITAEKGKRWYRYHCFPPV